MLKVAKSMKLLQYAAKEHSKTEEAISRDIKLQDQKKAIKENEVNRNIGDGQFRCSKCERVVSNNDTIDKHIEHYKKTCKHCAILQYDKKESIVPCNGTALHQLWGWQ